MNQRTDDEHKYSDDQISNLVVQYMNPFLDCPFVRFYRHLALVRRQNCVLYLREACLLVGGKLMLTVAGGKVSMAFQWNPASKTLSFISVVNSHACHILVLDGAFVACIFRFYRKRTRFVSLDVNQFRHHFLRTEPETYSASDSCKQKKITGQHQVFQFGVVFAI